MSSRKVMRALWQRANRCYAVRANVRLGQRVHIGAGSVLWAPTQLEVGDDVYIGKGCTIECDGAIGSGVLIANRVGIVGRRDHDLHALGVPVRHAPWAGDIEYRGLRSRCVIGSDVWIGYGAIILAPVVIGRGAVVAAGAVVTRDVKPYSIVASNPARVVGARFDALSVERHERLIASQHDLRLVEDGDADYAAAISRWRAET